MIIIYTVCVSICGQILYIHKNNAYLELHLVKKKKKNTDMEQGCHIPKVM